jgi:serpin B
MRQTTIPIFIAILLMMFSACSEQNDCDCDPPELRSITSEEEQVIAASNDFSFDIFARINQQSTDENVFISPLSISTALSMTANGAVGSTKEGIKTALHQGEMSDTEINEAYQSLSEFLTDLDPKVTMQLANSNWYKDAYHIEETFKNILLEYYSAEVKPANFTDPATKDLINGWIEDNTNGKIKDMIDAIPPDVVMYLINAIYLNADWKYQFDEGETEGRSFYLANGQTIQTDMMYSKGVKANAYFHQDFQYVELPYGNGQFVFAILMPNESLTLNNRIEDLNYDEIQSFVNNSDTGTFEVYLPKFKIEHKLLLNEVLSAMGMEQSFGGNADFSDLFVEDLSLFISRVIHQSFIEVDEKGTEAAAATVVEIRETSIGPGSKPTVLRFDKPFAFFIRERHSNSILFAGKLLDPSKAK